MQTGVYIIHSILFCCVLTTAVGCENKKTASEFSFLAGGNFKSPALFVWESPSVAL